MGGRVGACRPRPQRHHARDEQRLHLPIRRRPDRRAVDAVRRTGRKRVVLRLIAASPRVGETGGVGNALEHGVDAFTRQEWATAHEQLAQADRAAPLGPEDLERWAVAAYLVGDEPGSSDAWTRAHRQYEERGDVGSAVRCAFWIAFGLLNKGEVARGGGWF